MPMQEAAPIGRDTFPPTRYSCPSQALGCEGRPAVPRPPMLRREPSSDPPRHDPGTDAVSRGDWGPSVAQVFRNHLIRYTCTGFGTDLQGKPVRFAANSDALTSVEGLWAKMRWTRRFRQRLPRR